MITFIPDAEHQNMIQLSHIATLHFLHGKELAQAETADGHFLGVVKTRQLEKIVVQIIPAEGWENLSISEGENGVPIIIRERLIGFVITAAGNVLPFLPTCPPCEQGAGHALRHESGSAIYTTEGQIFDNEADFLESGGK